MKAIERLGANVATYWYLWLTFFGVMFWAISQINTPRKVEIDEKHWECTLPVAVGIRTECRAYSYKGFK